MEKDVRTIDLIKAKVREALEVGERKIQPNSVADAVYEEHYPHHNANEYCRLWSVLTLRHFARQVCRNLFEIAEEPDLVQHRLWPKLQAMYPVRHQLGETPSYVALEDMTGADLFWNVDTLHTEGVSKINHSKALEQWAYDHGFEREQWAAA